MKINKKLAALMMTFVIAGTVLTGCGTKTENEKPSTEQGTTNETEDKVTPEETNTPEENTGNEEEQTGEVDPTVAKETIFVITDGLELPGSMEMDSAMFADTYGIDPELLSSYAVQMPMMMVHSTEIAVFEVKDEANVEAVKAGIEKRQKALENQWQSYLPDQLELVKNSKVAVKGNLVLYVVSEHADEIVAKFEA